MRRVRQAGGGLQTAFRGMTVGPAKRLSISAARQLADIGYNSRVVRGALESVTAVRQRAVTRVLRDLDTAGSALSDANQRALSRLVTRLDADADTTRVLRRFDEEGRLDDLTSVIRCSVGRGSISSSIAVAGGATAPTGTFGSASAPALTVAPSCPLELGDVDADTALQATRNLKRAREDGDLSTEEFTRVADRLFESDADADVLVRTLAEGDDDAARFVADADPQALARFTRLSDEAEIPEQRLRGFAQKAGADGGEFVSSFNDADALRQLFEFDSGRAGQMRVKLANYNTFDEVDFRIEDIEQFARDIQTLEGTDGLERSIIDSIANQPFDNANAFNNIQGDVFEARVGGKLGKDNIAELGREAESVELDIIKTDNGLVEVKSSKRGNIDADDIRSQVERQLDYQKNVLGKDEPDVVVVVKNSQPPRVQRAIDEAGGEYIEIDDYLNGN